MDPPTEMGTQSKGTPGPAAPDDTAFGRSRVFVDNRLVYTVISPRAHGLAVGVNLNPDKARNFDGVQREVNCAPASSEPRLDVPVMIAELERLLDVVRSGGLREWPCYRSVPPELLELRQVNLGGDGEPTLCPNFSEAVEAIVHLRARGRFPFFKLVLITNAIGLDRPEVVQGLSQFSPRDEVWAKFDAGSSEYLNPAHRSDRPVEKILDEILFLARQRPVIIQSLFLSINGEPPPSAEIEAYAQRLRELKQAGAQIPLVQIYSATRPTSHSECGHLRLRELSHIARRVRAVSGLKADVF